MECPPDRQPFRYDKDGAPLPLFVPAIMLEGARRNFKGIWVEEAPFLPYPGRPYTAADVRQAA